MNIDSARNRVKIIEGLAKRIDRHFDCQVLTSSNVVIDLETILRQCRFLALDLEECTAHVGKQYDAHCGGVRE